MKRILVLIMILLALSILMGCASNYAITFDSSPQGATVVCDGTEWGYAPITLYVKTSKTLTVNCGANWISGAFQRYHDQPISIKEFPKGLKLTAYRPNEPGYEQDAEFAMQAQQLKYMQQQNEISQQMLYQQQFNNMNQNKTVNCYTMYGRTTCY